MIIYDLCVAWNWEYDTHFIALLETGCQTKGLSLLQITPNNLAETLHLLAEQVISCRSFFDRASDEDPQFMPLVQWVHENRIFGINAYERASQTWDKAEMHSQLMTVGLDVPHTIILPPYFDQPHLPCLDVFSPGEQFTIKPAHGSGGVGVVTNVSSWDQVLTVRQQHASDKYLLQVQVAPKEIDGRPGWFRVIYCAGKTYPCWWNPYNHVYSPVVPEEKYQYGLEMLDDTVVAIARLCGLDLFSTEIAISDDGQFKAVDYVNDQIDLRLQSIYYDGVPDAIVNEIVNQLVGQILIRT